MSSADHPARRQASIAHPSLISVLMLNPRVGLIPDISSSFSFFSIVVFPALSRPLEDASVSYETLPECGSSQEQDPHFLRLRLVFPNDGEETYKNKSSARFS